jgi:hypothetical protein
VIHFTVAFVPTGIKIGVSIFPWGVSKVPALANQSVLCNSKSNIILYIFKCKSGGIV